MTDFRKNIEVKDQLDSADFVGDQDRDELFSCKFCFLIVLDPLECIECNSLLCSKCI